MSSRPVFGASRPNDRTASLLVVGGCLFVAAAAYVGARTSALALEILVAMAAGALTVLWRNRARLFGATRVQPKPSPLGKYWWVPVAWIVFTWISSQRYTQYFNDRSVDDASSGNPSLANVVEIIFYMLMAAVLFFAWLPRRNPYDRYRAVPMLAWPCFGLLSTAWSLVPKYSAVRGFQLFVPVLFAIFTARLLDRVDDDGDAVARPYLRMFTTILTGLAIFAFVDPPLATQQDGRLTWYGVHTLVAAEFFAVGTLVLLFAGHRYLRMSLAGWAIRLGIIAVACAKANSRGSFAALIVGSVVGLWVVSRGKPVQRFFGIGFYLAAWFGALVLFAAKLLDIAERGQGEERLMNFNGRFGLWDIAIHQFQTIKQVFIGFGLGGTRQLLPSKVEIGGQAHNSAIEALISCGTIGLLLLVSMLFCIGWRLRSKALTRPLSNRLHAVLAAVLAFQIVLGVGSPELASVSFAYTWVCFIAAFTLRSRLRPTAARGTETAAIQPLAYSAFRFS